jgi:chromosome segregation ATPase
MKHFSGSSQCVATAGGSVVSSLQRQALTGLLAASGPADTRHALEQLAAQLGLNDAARGEDPSRLWARQRELESQLQRLQSLESRQSLEARQRQLEAELSQTRQQTSGLHYVGHEVDRRRIDQRIAAVEADLRSVIEQMEQLDRAIAAKTNELSLLDESHAVPDIGTSYREQL